jgi:putative thioredoxin
MARAAYQPRRVWTTGGGGRPGLPDWPPAVKLVRMSETQPSHVIDVTRETFEREVIEQSHERPVVVDFWAEWCAPCRTLGPVLEKLAGEFAGKFVLAKADSEALPEVAAEFGVRSIPAVFGVRDGRIVDAFVGALPESSIRAWLERLLPTPAEVLVAEAKELEPVDAAAAEARYRSALALSPTYPAARAGLARALMHQDKLDLARAEIAALEGRGFLEPEAEAAKAELALRTQAGGTGGVKASRAALAANPADPALRFKLAEALAASGANEEALELALALVEEHRKDLGEDARKLMVNVFQLLPPDSELAAEYRRKLSAALY